MNCCWFLYSLDAVERPSIRHTMSGANRLVIAPVPACHASKAARTAARLASAGTCAPRDLPTAYRWFALALHKEPDNQALQDDLQKLWSQMTQPERQLAIRLSQ